MARFFKTAALSLVVGLSGWMFGCDAQTGNSGVRSTYGNIEIPGPRAGPSPGSRSNACGSACGRRRPGPRARHWQLHVPPHG